MTRTGTVKGSKVKLRPPEDADFDVLSQLRNDPALQRQLMIARGKNSPAEVRAWIKRRTEDPQGVFFVVDATGPSGFVQLTRIDRKAKSADLGICLAKSSRGTGAAAEAMNLVEKFARQRLKCARLTLRVLRINHRAVALYRKLGYQTITIERRSHDDDGCWRDVVFMEKALA